MAELHFSSSLIGAWWRALKHPCLFPDTLGSVETVEELVSFYDYSPRAEKRFPQVRRA